VTIVVALGISAFAIDWRIEIVNGVFLGWALGLVHNWFQMRTMREVIDGQTDELERLGGAPTVRSRARTRSEHAVLAAVGSAVVILSILAVWFRWKPR
jgi:hypothetical protein